MIPKELAKQIRYLQIHTSKARFCLVSLTKHLILCGPTK